MSKVFAGNIRGRSGTGFDALVGPLKLSFTLLGVASAPADELIEFARASTAQANAYRKVINGAYYEAYDSFALERRVIQSEIKEYKIESCSPIEHEIWAGKLEVAELLYSYILKALKKLELIRPRIRKFNREIAGAEAAITQAGSGESTAEEAYRLLMQFCPRLSLFKVW